MDSKEAVPEEQGLTLNKMIVQDTRLIISVSETSTSTSVGIRSDGGVFKEEVLGFTDAGRTQLRVTET